MSKGHGGQAIAAQPGTTAGALGPPVVELHGVSRVFRVYSRPQDRLWSAFHLEFLRKPRYRELWALRDIDLTVARGERVGIVGRNGAGKSTLLKIVCGNLPATEGRVTVRGRVQALMELGTGFHPEFTGWENITAFLSYQGIVGNEAKRKQEEAADFSELDEFLDFPVKTYSAGMYARLAFSAATCVEPELLIIDEVLGAGDAYFAGKCLERMRELTGGGATVLFVSHDLTSVQLLCDRAVWIDRGRIVADGDCLEVSRRYLREVRREEEDRLRAASQKIRKRAMGTIDRAAELYTPMLFHLVCDALHPREDHVMFRVAVRQGGEVVRELAIGDALDNDPHREAFIYDDSGFMDWSRPRKIGKRYARAYCDQGGRYQHAPWEFHVPAGRERDPRPLELEIEYLDDGEETVHVELYDDPQYLRLGSIRPAGTGEVRSARFPIPRAEAEEEFAEAATPMGQLEPSSGNAIAVGAKEGYGTGQGRITGFALLDADCKPCHLFETRGRLLARIEYAFSEPVPRPVFAICIYRADGTCATQVFCSPEEQWRSDVPMAGWVEAVSDPCLLGRGYYSVSVAIFHYVDPEEREEPPAYHLLDRFYRFQVVQPPGVNVELGGLLMPVSWVQSHRAQGAAEARGRSVS